MSRRKLGESEIVDKLPGLSGWQLAQGKLHRELRFANFVEAFGFMTRVALLAEARDHHPEWSNVYGRVTIDLCTHDSGGITEADFDLAAAIDALSERP